MMRGCRLQSPDRAPRGLPGSSDVICGIGATAPGVRPQPKRGSSTADRAPKLLILRTNRSRIRAGRVRRTEFAPGEPDRAALIVNFAEANHPDSLWRHRDMQIPHDEGACWRLGHSP